MIVGRIAGMLQDDKDIESLLKYLLGFHRAVLGAEAGDPMSNVDAALILLEDLMHRNTDFVVAVVWRILRPPRDFCALPPGRVIDELVVRHWNMVQRSRWAGRLLPILLDMPSLSKLLDQLGEDACFSVSPIHALRMATRGDSRMVEFACKSLRKAQPNLLVFFVPQIVQILRRNVSAFFRSAILDVAQVSNIFAHQLIWHIRSNMYLDEACLKPDPMQVVLESIIRDMERGFGDAERRFYEREFGFFRSLADISCTLRPLLRADRYEKKAQLDVELGKLRVERGVYLPSSPEFTVVDIYTKSGRPLQSHAKTPFMATFQVEDGGTVMDRAVIFKSGDDCRQDMLALQLIRIVQSIFRSAGLSLFLYPYRVVATAPWVIPDAISRDQLGREKINSLYDYFVVRFGPEDSIGFARARTNFISSLAAYSVVSYLLAVKDRHNGNIMIDDVGHIIHIDFGFILDISPGGINFESVPFKLTQEMCQLMGGSVNSVHFSQFKARCVQAFLAVRPYAEELVQLAQLLAESGLPCFKYGAANISKFRLRFKLELNERAASDYVEQLVSRSLNSSRTWIYDSFQYQTNAIPY